MASCYSGTGDAVPYRLGADVMRLGLPDGIPSISEFEETVKDLVRAIHSLVPRHIKRASFDVQLAPSEKEALAQTFDEEDKLDLLMHYWATKEAVSKAIGAGLSHPYETLDSSAVRSTGEIPLPGLGAGGKICKIRQREIQGSDGLYLCVLALLFESTETAAELGDVGLLLQELQIEQSDVHKLAEDIIACAEVGDS